MFVKNFKEILERTQHRVVVIFPVIKDIEAIEIYNVRSGVNFSLACFIDKESEEDMDLFEELEGFENLEVRNYSEEDRWVILRDGEEVLSAVIGTDEKNHLVFHTRDPAQVKILSYLATDAWLRSRKI